MPLAPRPSPHPPRGPPQHPQCAQTLPLKPGSTAFFNPGSRFTGPFRSFRTHLSSLSDMTSSPTQSDSAPETRAETRKRRGSVPRGASRTLRRRRDPEASTSGRLAGAVTVRTRREACARYHGSQSSWWRLWSRRSVSVCAGPRCGAATEPWLRSPEPSRSLWRGAPSRGLTLG